MSSIKRLIKSFGYYIEGTDMKLRKISRSDTKLVHVYCTRISTPKINLIICAPVENHEDKIVCSEKHLDFYGIKFAGTSCLEKGNELVPPPDIIFNDADLCRAREDGFFIPHYEEYLLEYFSRIREGFYDKEAMYNGGNDFAIGRFRCVSLECESKCEGHIIICNVHTLFYVVDNLPDDIHESLKKLNVLWA